MQNWKYLGLSYTTQYPSLLSLVAQQLVIVQGGNSIIMVCYGGTCYGTLHK